MSPAALALTIAAEAGRFPHELWPPAVLNHAGLYGASDVARSLGCDRCAAQVLRGLLRRVRVNGAEVVR